MDVIQLPKVNLGIPVTPLEEAPRLTAALGGPKVFIKRDDLTGLGLGGNKVRKLEYLLGDALKHGADTVITTAAFQSNFLRITAAACRRVGLKAVFFVRGTGKEPLSGNALCYHLMGAEVHFVDTKDPYASSTVEAMREYAGYLKRKGYNPYLIHLATFSGPLATLGYVEGTRELLSQTRSLGVSYNYAFVAVGSGGTVSGMLLGFAEAAFQCRVVGVSVSEQAPSLRKRIEYCLEESCKLADIKANVNPEDISITDRFIGEGHGVPTKEGLDAIRLVASTEGILLDPVYTGKAMAALIAAVKTGQIGPDSNVLFLHTGGIPNLFYHAHAFCSKVGGSEDGENNGR